ncbi:phospholipid scramblase 2-like isoform X2 [Brachyhypopomus gauderio]|uniref:phospholipid scramblase 2-like isoform X2 n=1 Tax=Brachyhypopomus gauderio TaxID=698409 RepID=UPI004042658E
MEMAKVKEELLKALLNLGEKHLKSFQWYLTNCVEGSKTIPIAQLENADRYETVDMMVQSYHPNGAVDVMLNILVKMNLYQQAEDLKNNLQYRYMQAQSAPKEMPSLPDCPPGLEFLTQIDQLLVFQEGWLSCNCKSRFTVTNILGQRVFFGVEENNVCLELLCRPSLILHVHDNMEQEVLTIRHPSRFSSCWYSWCLKELEVQAPPGDLLGYVTEECHPYLSQFTIRNSKKEAVLRLETPFNPFNCYPVTKLVSLDGASVMGTIRKERTTGPSRRFRIHFLMDVDMKTKALILGATLLITLYEEY